MKQVKVKSNNIICKQGEECNSIYIIKSGRVKIVRDVAFFPVTKYEQATSNDIYREDPLLQKLD